MEDNKKTPAKKKSPAKTTKKEENVSEEIGIDASGIDGASVDGRYLIYRDKPLVRSDKVLVYGDMTDDYILFLGVMTTKPVETENGTVDVPDSIMVQILKTDTSIPNAARMVKQGIKNGMYEALDIGFSWLKRYNEGNA